MDNFIIPVKNGENIDNTFDRIMKTGESEESSELVILRSPSKAPAVPAPSAPPAGAADAGAVDAGAADAGAADAGAAPSAPPADAGDAAADAAAAMEVVEQAGGANPYYAKYLKYKNKYLALKKQLA